MKNWKVELMAGKKTLADVKIQKGIFQGDILFPLLFVMAMILLLLLLFYAGFVCACVDICLEIWM